MEVRTARREDLLEIGRLAHRAWWEAYAGLVDAETINSALEANYSPSTLAERLLANVCFVATEGNDTLGFAEFLHEPDRVVIHTLYCEPGRHHHRIGSGLLEAIQALTPDVPICSDVVLGNLVTESLYEAWGFVPGEVIEKDLGGEAVVNRRWWLPPYRQSSKPARSRRVL